MLRGAALGTEVRGASQDEDRVTQRVSLQHDVPRAEDAGVTGIDPLAAARAGQQ